MNQQIQPVTPLVLAAGIEPPACRTVALTLADLQDHCGASFAASMQQLAGVVGLSKVQTRKHVHALIAMGVLKVTANAHGGAPGLVPHYRFDALRLRALAQQSGKTPISSIPRLRRACASSQQTEKKLSSPASGWPLNSMGGQVTALFVFSREFPRRHWLWARSFQGFDVAFVCQGRVDRMAQPTAWRA